MHLARSWLEQRLADQGLSIEQLVHLESQNQAADQVSVSHTITSLRFLSAMDWQEFVETLSQVEQTLRLDPAGVYGKMDFFTRDRYRHSVEAISRHSQLPESEVAQKAIQLAEDSAREKGIQDRTAHVGFYLIDKGLAALERAAEVRRPWRTAIERRIHRFPLTFYAGGIVLLTALATFGLIQPGAGARGAGLETGFLHARFPPLCQPTGRGVDELAVHAAGQTPPAPAPGLLRRHRARVPHHGGRAHHVDQFRSGSIGSSKPWRFIISRIGIKHLHFALLTDFRDAPEETLPEDKSLLQRARAGVEMLNAQISVRPAQTSSSCSTGRAAGTKPKACGWVMNASGEN